MLALALTTSSLAAAASTQASQAAGPPSPDERRNAISTTRNAILADPPALLASGKDAFTLTSTVAGVRGLQYLTYARSYAGLPVYGGDVIAATDESGAVVNTLTTGQRAEIAVRTEPKVGAPAAALTARARVARPETVATPVLSVHAAAARPRLAWEVAVAGATEKGHETRLHVFVDAVTGKVIDEWDDVRDGTGNGYYNGTVTIDTTPSYTMRDPRRSGVACGGQNGTPYTKTTDTWGNGSGTNLETACVDALYAAQREWDMLRDWLGRNGINGQGGGYPSRVGLNAVNAYWNGSYGSFGHNSANSQQLTSMDVVGHEFGHGIFQFTSGGAGSGNETGGMNESTGDVFGALTEAFANNPNDPPDYLVGEEVNLSGSGPIRNMYNPAALGHPNCYSASIPSTEVHAAAGPQNHWFYLVAEGTNPPGKPASGRCDNGAAITGIGIRKAGEVFMSALNTKTQPWTHAKARVATLQAAKTLYPGSCAEFNVVKSAWDGVSVRAQTGEPTCQQGGNDFSMGLEPASGSVTPGQSVTTTVRTTVTGGSAQSITLRTGTLPAGVTATVNPATISAGQTATLTLTTSPGSPQGNHAVTITADGADVDRQATYNLQIGQTSQDDYSFSVSPSSASVQAGESATATISTQVTSGQAQSVTLSAGNVPAGVTVGFSPQTITAGQTSAVTIATTSGVPPSTYTISLNGDGTAADHSASFSLTVGGGQDTTWQTYTAYAVGQTVTYQGVSYRCRQAHTSLPGWEPPNTPALWQRV
ncbi:M4 family metallopeptidase [Nonomuraea zeae]|uniref:Leupeptin-inactivating enzyme 2 n=1 Tax=Nonomuraea zeae TaxID=1642303 RepID=A0A5S4GXZ0_9ACTN|nr:M4 family metallopeptidase [Nonomuraea zeae]TMR37747.1 Leupeptin-inactivating enzyme 2 [Nonomuraea zeae]